MDQGRADVSAAAALKRRSDGPLNASIVEAFDILPAQPQTAARYMLDRPDDVALLSMREQARRADAAGRLHDARRIYCLGLRSCHAAAWHFHYMLSLLGDRTVMLDDAGGTGLDAIRDAGSGDVLLAASVEPYARATIEGAQYAASRGVPVVALTDSEVSSLTRLAEAAILVMTDSPSFFHAMTSLLAVAEAQLSAFTCRAVVCTREHDAAGKRYGAVA